MTSDSGTKVESDAGWFAVYTRHHHEMSVARSLNSKGFETLLPLYQVERRWADRAKVIATPLFPCYVFIKGNVDRALEIVVTPGIHSLVLCAGLPARIPAIEIENLRRGLASGVRAEPHPFLTNGDRVRVKRGPLEGMQGILVRKKNLYRLLISVEMLGKAVALEIDVAKIERLNERELSKSQMQARQFLDSKKGMRNQKGIVPELWNGASRSSALR